MYRVMIVEDEIIVRVWLKSMINWERLGLKVVADTGNGKEALQLYEEYKPEIIITDLRMPIMGGMELIREIRKTDKTTRVIILTCLDEFAILKEAISLDVSGYVLKLSSEVDEGMRGLTVRERMEKVKSNIEAIGFPKPSIIVSSGNGIHTYWLLDKRVGDGAVEVVKLLSKATNGDVRVAEKARVMRLPGTLNIKNINEPLKCEIIQADYSLIYNLESFKDILKDNIGQVKENPPQVNYGSTNTILDNVNVDRSCINLILKGVGEGERNFALGRLTKWLQIKGSTKSKSQQIILAWNNLNDPPEKRQKLIQDFNHYWHGDYKLLGCAINNPHIQQLLNKYCNRPECKFSMAIGNIQLDNTVKYNNRLLNDLYKLTGNDLILYGLLVRYKEGLFTSLLNEKLTSRATRKPCISKPTRLKSLNKLKKIGFIDVIEERKHNLLLILVVLPRKSAYMDLVRLPC
jgi:CheY-like chemotaxis protein